MDKDEESCTIGRSYQRERQSIPSLNTPVKVSELVRQWMQKGIDHA